MAVEGTRTGCYFVIFLMGPAGTWCGILDEAASALQDSKVGPGTKQ